MGSIGDRAQATGLIKLSCLGLGVVDTSAEPFLLRSILKRPFVGLLQTPPIPEERTTGSSSPSGLDGWRCRTHYLRNTVGGLGWAIAIVWRACKKFVEKLYIDLTTADIGVILHPFRHPPKRQTGKKNENSNSKDDQDPWTGCSSR